MTALGGAPEGAKVGDGGGVLELPEGERVRARSHDRTSLSPDSLARRASPPVQDLVALRPGHPLQRARRRGPRHLGARPTAGALPGRPDRVGHLAGLRAAAGGAPGDLARAPARPGRPAGGGRTRSEASRPLRSRRRSPEQGEERHRGPGRGTAAAGLPAAHPGAVRAGAPRRRLAGPGPPRHPALRRRAASAGHRQAWPDPGGAAGRCAGRFGSGPGRSWPAAGRVGARGQPCHQALAGGALRGGGQRTLRAGGEHRSRRGGAGRRRGAGPLPRRLPRPDRRRPHAPPRGGARRRPGRGRPPRGLRLGAGPPGVRRGDPGARRLRPDLEGALGASTSRRAVGLAIDCAPCSNHGGSRCPKGHHRCMVDLEARTVADEARAMLALAS